MTSQTEPELIVRRQGRAMLLTLNRPRALNALNRPMAIAVHRALFEAAADPEIEVVVIEGAGERAFCAGGDVAQLGREGRTDQALWEGFFHDEYRMNQAIARLAMPYVALMDGFTMGGGVGLSLHGSFRVVTEHTAFAMPETGIGLIPDVGATHALPRLPGQIGTWLALTGTQLKAADCLYAGIATHFVPRDRLPLLKELLSVGEEPVETVLDTLDALPPAAEGTFPLASLQDGIDYHFAHDHVEDILASLDSGDNWAREQAAIIRTMSPTSLKLSLAALRLGADADIEEALMTEYRIVCQIRHGHDFFEGIRAQLIDKDRNPQWNPVKLESVSEDDVARHLMPPESGDLTFE